MTGLRLPYTAIAYVHCTASDASVFQCKDSNQTFKLDVFKLTQVYIEYKFYDFVYMNCSRVSYQDLSVS